MPMCPPAMRSNVLSALPSFAITPSVCPGGTMWSSVATMLSTFARTRLRSTRSPRAIIVPCIRRLLR
jgi:hypothetical protein